LFSIAKRLALNRGQPFLHKISLGLSSIKTYRERLSANVREEITDVPHTPDAQKQQNGKSSKLRQTSRKLLKKAT